MPIHLSEEYETYKEHRAPTSDSPNVFLMMNSLRLEHPENGNIDNKILPNVYTSISVNAGFHLKTEYQLAKSCQYSMENLVN